LLKLENKIEAKS
jgi:hypothetical protein